MSIDWADIVTKVSTLINTGAPVVEELIPAWAPAIQIAAKLLQGVASAEPTAVALVKTIQSGTAPTPTELQQFGSDYEAAYQTLHADIATQLAKTPA